MDIIDLQIVKNKSKKWLYLLGVFAFAYALVDHFLLQKIPKIYPDFGVSIPSGYTVHGIDVSKYQKDIDWKLVSAMRDKGAKLDFAIIKATEGVNLMDKCYKYNWKGCKENGLIRGAYHYFHPNQDGKKQAEYFIKNTCIEGGDLAPVVDVEETNGVKNETLKTRLKDCLHTLQDKYNCKPIIYCNVDFYRAHLAPDFDNYPLWGAHYYVNKPDINRDWTIWQHNDRGHVNGIDANVDFNTINGTLMNLKSLCVD